jgi:hypothetical protein
MVIYSSEYLGKVLHFSNEKIIEDLKNVFSKGLKKGIIYPYEADGELHNDKVKVYQKGGHYAKYWWKSFGLREESSNKEILQGFFKEYEDEKGEKISFTEEYVGKIIKRNGDVAASKIKLVCGGVEVGAEFSKLYRNIIPVEKDGEERIVIKGGDIFIEISKDEFRKFHPDEGYRKYNEI